MGPHRGDRPWHLGGAPRRHPRSHKGVLPPAVRGEAQVRQSDRRRRVPERRLRHRPRGLRRADPRLARPALPPGPAGGDAEAAALAQPPAVSREAPARVHAAERAGGQASAQGHGEGPGLRGVLRRPPRRREGGLVRAFHLLPAVPAAGARARAQAPHRQLRDHHPPPGPRRRRPPGAQGRAVGRRARARPRRAAGGRRRRDGDHEQRGVPGADAPRGGERQGEDVAGALLPAGAAPGPGARGGAGGRGAAGAVQEARRQGLRRRVLGRVRARRAHHRLPRRQGRQGGGGRLRRLI